MHLGQATDYHSTVSLDGWRLGDPLTQWISGVSKGNFHTFNRFISNRSFGQNTRLFTTNNKGPIADTYPVVRTMDGRRYIVGSHNVDIGGSALPYSPSQYVNIYQFEEADLNCEIIEFQTVTAASGVPGSKTDVVIATVPGGSERLSGASSKEFDSIDYTNFNLTLPGGVAVNTDNEIRIDGTYYDIQEVYPALRKVVLLITKRSYTV